MFYSRALDLFRFWSDVGVLIIPVVPRELCEGAGWEEAGIKLVSEGVRQKEKESRRD